VGQLNGFRLNSHAACAETSSTEAVFGLAEHLPQNVEGFVECFAAPVELDSER
jgi:hypothetical protein